MRRGEVYFVPLDPIRGREQGGRRPVVVVSSDAINQLPLVVTVVPGTDGRNIPVDRFHSVRVSPDDSGLPRGTVFLCFQVRALDPAVRFPAQPDGVLPPAVMARIDATLRLVLNLPT